MFSLVKDRPGTPARPGQTDNKSEIELQKISIFKHVSFIVKANFITISVQSYENMVYFVSVSIVFITVQISIYVAYVAS